MGQPAARVTDMVLQDAPHCHAPIHPSAPVPTPVPHTPIPLAILHRVATVNIGGLPAARVGDPTHICNMGVCVPAGPGIIATGSATVIIESMPAARKDDMTSHPGCVAPIPSPIGKVQGPCCTTVNIGG